MHEGDKDVMTNWENARALRARYYRETAARLREVAHSSVFWSIRSDFSDLADKYDRLAERVRSSRSAKDDSNQPLS